METTTDRTRIAAAYEHLKQAAYLTELACESLSPVEGLAETWERLRALMFALRMLFDWLVTGQVIPLNPAASVKAPKHVVKKGKTPVLSAEDARTLLDSIPLQRGPRPKDGEPDTRPPDLLGLRDRALIGV